MTTKLKVTQHFRVKRTLTLNVAENEDPEGVELPEWADDKWEESWELIDEEREVVDA